MTNEAGRSQQRPMPLLLAMLCIALWAATTACLASAAARQEPSAIRNVAASRDASRHDATARQRAAAWHKTKASAHKSREAAAPAPDLTQLEPLPYSDEFDRAELIERMLNECRGVAYNAYELAQTSGEALWLPAPTQLLVVRVRHPWCAELLRTYAPKKRV